MASFSVDGRITLDSSDAVSALEELQEKLDQLAGNSAQPTVTADTQEAEENLEQLDESLDELDGKDASTTVTADTEEAQEDVEDTRAQVDSLDGTVAEVTVTADTSEADGKLDETKANATATDATGGGAAGGGGSFGSTGSSAEDADQSVNELKSSMGQLAATGPMAATALAGGFAALPGILSGVSGAIGGLVAGLMGVMQAISAYTSVENSAAQTGLQMQSQQISAAQSMQNAAAQVESASTSLSQAQVQAYDSVYNAQEQLTMSEQQLEAAQYGQRASQLALTEATMQAKFQLQNYQDQIASMAIQLQEAEVNVQQTHLALAQTLGDPAATQLQREQAQVAYEQAVQQVSSLTTQQSQLKQEYALANSLGVQGSQQVQSATQGVTQANYQLVDSQKGVQTSGMMLSQAQVSSAQNVQQAQEQLTLALSAQKATAEQVAITMATPIGAYGQLDEAMAALGPAGQQFVDWFMQSMYPVLKQLEYGAEGALLPGIEKALEMMGPYFSQMAATFDKFDSAFGPVLQSWAKFLDSKQGLAEFNAAMASGLVFMKDFGHAILLIMQGFGKLAEVGGPATEAIGNAIVEVAGVFDKWASSPAMKILVDGFLDLISVFNDLFKDLGGAAGLGVIIMLASKFSGFGLILGAFITFLPQLMPLFRALFGVFKALESALGPVMPLIDHLVAELGGTLAHVLIELTPDIKLLATAFLELVTGSLKMLIPIFDSLLKILVILIRDGLLHLLQTVMFLMPALIKIAPILVVLIGAFETLVGVITVLQAILAINPFTLIVIAIAGLIVLIVALAMHWRQVWNVIKDVALDVWHFLEGDVFEPLANFLGPVMGPVLNTFRAIFSDAWSGIRDVVEDVWNFLYGDVFEPLEHFFGGVINTELTIFRDAFTDAFDIVKDVVSDAWSVISPIFNAIGSGVRDVTGAIKDVTGIASSAEKMGKGVVGDITKVLGFAAEGGYVNGPTPLIVGEAGPEVIIPLSNPQRAMELMQGIAQDANLPQPTAGTAANGGSSTVINLSAITTADPSDIAQEIAWALKTHAGTVGV